MKRVLVSLLLLTTVSNAFAQNVIKIEPFLSIERNSFPASLAVNKYNYENAEASVNDSRLSSKGVYVGIGATLEYPITKKLSLRFGLAYANRHFKATRVGDCLSCTPDDENLNSYQSHTKFRLSYIDIPLAARYYFLSKRFLVYADAGITTSPRVHNETVVSQSSMKPSNIHIKDAPFNEVMFMSQFGMGAGIRFDRAGINISAVYRNGLTKFLSTDDYRFKSWGANLALFFRIAEPVND